MSDAHGLTPLGGGGRGQFPLRQLQLSDDSPEGIGMNQEEI
jgi:hypothetical protein